MGPLVPVMRIVLFTLVAVGNVVLVGFFVGGLMFSCGTYF